MVFQCLKRNVIVAVEGLILPMGDPPAHVLEQHAISFGQLRRLMASASLEARAVAYQILTTPRLRAKVTGFAADPSHPEFCLTYLADCVRQNIGWESEMVHSQPEALFEMKVPLEPYWAANNASLATQVYWSLLTRLVQDLWPNHVDAIVTHWLEGGVSIPGFEVAMRSWKQDERTAAYVAKVEILLKREF